MQRTVFDQQRISDAEDRNIQQINNGQYQAIQTSPFTDSMQLATMFESERERNEDSYVQNSAFAYNEHRRREAFKRERSFSNSQDGHDCCDDVISFGNESFINDEDGFD